jgi:hypothetical protein
MGGSVPVCEAALRNNPSPTFPAQLFLETEQGQKGSPWTAGVSPAQATHCFTRFRPEVPSRL